MATQVHTMSAPLATRNGSSGSILTQVLKLFIQPKAFFRALPMNRQWLLAALLVLAIAGFTGTTQIQSTGSSSANSSGTSSTSSFSLSTLQESATSAQTSTTTAAAAQQTTTSATTDSNTALMNALVAAAGIMAMWGGQAVLLSLVTMLRGYAPNIGKSLQIAVWASLPLALMLALRYAHFAAGGTGGSLGLSLLLTQWSTYPALPQFLRQVLAAFMSNVTLFALWNLGLLYVGARYALDGKRWSVALIVAMWIVAATVVPVFVGEPQTRIAVLPSTTSTQTQQTTTQSTSTTTSQQPQNTFPSGGQFPSDGGFPGGAPPSGGPDG
jgi:hypothetical protein